MPANAIHHNPSQSWSFGTEDADVAADVARRLNVGQKGGKLDLKGAGLTEVPQRVWDAMPYVDKLDLSDNKVNKGGSEIGYWMLVH